MQERLQKILSSRGIASRRKAEEYIKAGLVKVNGAVAVIGQQADAEKDSIEVDGKVLQARLEMLYYVMHKPRGVETTNIERVMKAPPAPAISATRQSPSRKKFLEAQITFDASESLVPSVRDLLPKELQGKLFPVGRLDKDSEGLLLFTNDGVLAYRLTHPKFDHEKEYEVTVAHDITNGQLKKLEEGMTISGEKTKPTRIKRLGPATFRITLTEGKNRQIRRMCQKVGCPVVTLRRVRIMTLVDASMKSGEVRQLSPPETQALLRSVGL